MIRKTTAFLLVLFLFLLSVQKVAAQEVLSPVGFWLTKDKDAIIEIYPCEDNELCGRFYWLKDDSADKPSLDDHNPDPEKKKRRLCGLPFMGGFEKEEGSHYRGGWIYSIRHGATFSAELTLHAPTRLELRGYIFLPLLGGSQTWTRVDHPPVCEGLPAR
ncbi:MAG: DUF2147 domain-containing protein [Bdellovibrionales bacterium]